MAITRRQFVTRMGAMAGAMGISQSQLAGLTEAFAYGSFGSGVKPKVIWIHGAECTGCSTSLLGLLEDLDETIEVGAELETVLTDSSYAGVNFTGLRDSAMQFEDDSKVLDITDVLLEVIDLQYHETVMGMGGDLAYQYLNDQMTKSQVAGTDPYFVLVVEGAVQPKSLQGYWQSSGAGGTDAEWCSIGMSDDGNSEIGFADAVEELAKQPTCAAVIAVGQCATYGGIVAAKSPALLDELGATANRTANQTGAMGVYDFLKNVVTTDYDKVINVPGCPVNPWWVILTVVAWIVDANQALNLNDPPLGILLEAGSVALNPAAMDRDRRLNAVYDYNIHGPYCPRYPYWAGDPNVCPGSVPVFAENPGDEGCLAKIGCKGLYTKSMCGVHGWNGRQPALLQTSTANDMVAWDSSMDHDIASQCDTYGTSTKVGGYCISAGSPCKGCTERGYPDSFAPFVDF